MSSTPIGPAGAIEANDHTNGTCALEFVVAAAKALIIFSEDLLDGRYDQRHKDAIFVSMRSLAAKIFDAIRDADDLI